MYLMLNLDLVFWNSKSLRYCIVKWRDGDIKQKNSRIVTAMHGPACLYYDRPVTFNPFYLQSIRRKTIAAFKKHSIGEMLLDLVEEKGEENADWC